MNLGVPARRFVAAVSIPVLPALALALGGSVPSAPVQFATQAQLSPDERWVAVTRETAEPGRLRCWLVPTSEGAARELTDVVSQGVDTLGWNAASQLRVQIVDREFGVPEMRWLDPATNEVASSTRDRDVMRAELRTRPGEWASVTDKRQGERRLLSTVEWLEAGSKLEIETLGDSRLELTAVPGLCFYSSTTGNETRVVRCDVGTGERREVLRSESPAFAWSASRDGLKLLVTEQWTEVRSRVVDAEQGTLIDGPWLTSSVRWVEGAGSRYVAATLGSRLVVLDTLRDRELQTRFETWPWMTALSDGRFLIEDDRKLELRDEEWNVVSELFTAPVEPAVASR